MIGNKTLAVPGPTNMPARIARAMSVPLEDHRAPDMAVHRSSAGRSENLISQKKVLLLCSQDRGQAAKAALRNLLCEGDHVLGSSFGRFRCFGWPCAASWGCRPQILRLPGVLSLQSRPIGRPGGGQDANH